MPGHNTMLTILAAAVMAASSVLLPAGSAWAEVASGTDAGRSFAAARTVAIVLDDVTAEDTPVGGAPEARANVRPEDVPEEVFETTQRDGEPAGQDVLDAPRPSLMLAEAERPLGEIVLTFLREGIRHIFIGPDHILFVLALILLGGPVRFQVRVVTAFTLAHSITLTLATLGLVVLPSRLVESVIALSIVVVGLHDLRQLGHGRMVPTQQDPRALLAFGFGLIHGFGFASVLQELDLPRDAFAWSLVAFNLGVEIGQVTIVLVAAPLFLTLRRFAPPLLARTALAAIAGGIVVVGGVWLWERAIGA